MRRIPLAFAVLSIVDAVTLFISVTEGPFPSIVPLGNPTAYRNLYIHVPISMSTYLLFTLGFLWALLYLIRQREDHEKLAHSFIIAGLIMGFSTLVTGMIWASESWGSPWNWDPRETGVLFMFLAFLIYLAVRSSVKDPDVRPRISMTFAVAAYSTIPLSFVVPYLIPSLHPTAPETGMFVKGGLTSILFSGRILIVALMSVFLAWMLYKGGSRKITYFTISILIAAVTITALQLPPNMAPTHIDPTGFKVQVIGGDYANSTLQLEVRVGGDLMKLIYKGEPPIHPIVVRVGGSERLTLEKHWLLVRGEVRDSLIEASSLNLIPYWGNSINSLIYAFTVITLAYMCSRERK